MGIRGQAEGKPVGKTEQALRDQQPAYASTHKVDAMRQAGWHRRIVLFAPVPAFFGTGAFFFCNLKNNLFAV